MLISSLLERLFVIVLYPVYNNKEKSIRVTESMVYMQNLHLSAVNSDL